MLKRFLTVICAILLFAATVQGARHSEPGPDLLSRIDSLGRELSGIEQEIRQLGAESGDLRDSLAALDGALDAQAIVVARLDSQYRILEAERQPLLKLLTRAVLSEVRLRRWAVLDALLGSDGPGDFMRRRASMTRLRESTKQRAMESAASLRELEAVEDRSLSEAARLDDRKRQVATILTELAARESELLNARTIAELQRTELVRQHATVLKSDALLLERHRQVAASVDTMGAYLRRAATFDAATETFLSLRGVLPWPTSGSVVSRFGKKQHRKLDTVTENPGIDLRVDDGAPVRAVARGQVTAVTWLRGFGHVCIVQHEGDHHTVYAKLGEIAVEPGDIIDSSTIVGYPGFDPTQDAYAVHFEVWSGKEKQDPLTWLAPAKKAQ
ncbi:MAG: peptidoglycan DD-metalloendopeptidase family protein [bacterium]|nr:peptidoglycan DD-metalloendopeptidase family protein [bacterium]